MAELTNQKIIVGMSGGVDSSVSAYLLQQQGYEVEGLFMKNWEEDDTKEYCSAAVDLADAQQACDKLDINLHTINFSSEYWDNVFEHFLAEYRAGRTPNPDIMCNKEIKFKAFLEHAQSLGAARIATGHYVRTKQCAGETKLLRGLDVNKDQSYFLYALNQHQISQALFPLGGLEKPVVRTIAEQQGLDVFNKKDSTGICFIGERKFKDFMQRFIPAQPGLIQSPDGETLGEHSGLMYYTIGQRQGLGIGGTEQGKDEPWYVIEKELSTNTLRVAQGHEHPRLFYNHCSITDLHWIGNATKAVPFNCTAKIRYRQHDQACRIAQIDGDHAIVQFNQAQRAITPGQALVFYDNEVCLGGGTIESAFNKEH
ncbi:MAG: tRNA 2-thiouridine(34) synthase MnmA [Gammaproteobacteria bacterium]|nr:tRNA 2-thiouridine(34) synthase MnmA [Gammaproteobacteria bacterium]